MMCLLGWRRLRDSRAFAMQCCRVVGVGALVGWWHCHGVSACALVAEGRDLTINLRGGRRREGGGGRAMHSMTSSMSRGMWHFGGMWWCIGRCCWGVGGRAMDVALAGSGIRGDAAVHQAVLLGERQQCKTRWRQRGEKVVQWTPGGSLATAFTDNAAVRRGTGSHSSWSSL